jgi:hypothetical protein
MLHAPVTPSMDHGSWLMPSTGEIGTSGGIPGAPNCDVGMVVFLVLYLPSFYRGLPYSGKGGETNPEMSEDQTV